MHMLSCRMNYDLEGTSVTRSIEINFDFFFSKSEINVRTIMLLCRMKCDLEGTSAFCLSLFCDST